MHVNKEDNPQPNTPAPNDTPATAKPTWADTISSSKFSSAQKAQFIQRRITGRKFLLSYNRLVYGAFQTSTTGVKTTLDPINLVYTGDTLTLSRLPNGEVEFKLRTLGSPGQFKADLRFLDSNLLLQKQFQTTTGELFYGLDAPYGSTGGSPGNRVLRVQSSDTTYANASRFENLYQYDLWNQLYPYLTRLHTDVLF